MRKRDKLLFVREPFLGPWAALAEVLLQDMLAKMRMVTVYLRGWRWYLWYDVLYCFLII